MKFRKSHTKKLQITKSQIREEVLKKNKRCKIKHDGDIFAYGAMPSTNKTGWYYICNVSDTCLVKNYFYFGSV